jgi:hypothetical protein
VKHPAVVEKLEKKSPNQLKRFFVALIGGTVVLIGLALVILPGPAFVVIPAGLAILATEFAWARRWLHRAKAMLTRNSKQAAASARNQ